ncbi:MAG: DinB family protein [Chloroflexi bacterium]|nr:DinB family protein [Chloroflexota bacterium]
MSSEPKEQWVVVPVPSVEEEIGRWLWAMQDARQRTLRAIVDFPPTLGDWRPNEQESSLGTLLYHIADIEADYALFPYPTRDRQGHLTHVPGFGLEEHLERLATVRGLLLTTQMPLVAWRQVRLMEHYDVTPEWVLHHLLQHEAEHRSQIGALRIQAERHEAQ